MDYRWNGGAENKTNKNKWDKISKAGEMIQ